MLIRPYGDTRDDGVVQFPFTLPMPYSVKAHDVGKQFLEKLGFHTVGIAECKAIDPDYTFFVAYGRTDTGIDPDEVKGDYLEVEVMDYYTVNDLIKEKLRRNLSVVGAALVAWGVAYRVVLAAEPVPASKQEEPVTKPRGRGEPIVVCKDAGAGGYQAFPDVVRLRGGDLLVVFYAGYDHVSLPRPDLPRGARVCSVRSRDGGRTWGELQTVADTPWDDRDPSVCQLSDGTLVCNWFTYYAGRPERRQGIRPGVRPGG